MNSFDLKSAIPDPVFFHSPEFANPGLLSIKLPEYCGYVP